MITLMAESTQKKKYGYGKRPLWQWIVLYVIIGIIVYGAIYYFFLAKQGGYTYNPSGQSSQQNYNYNK